MTTTNPSNEFITYAFSGVGTLLLLTLPVAAFQWRRMRRARARKLSMNHRKTLSTVAVELSSTTVGVDVAGMARPMPPPPSKSMPRALSRAMSGIAPPSGEEGATLVTSSTSSEFIADDQLDLSVHRNSLSTKSFGVESAS